jgi:hypothetical protein
MEKSFAFATSDAWVLLAAIYGGAGKGADLDAILSAGDYLNHAIMSYEELDGGLARLLSARWIAQRGDRFYLSQAVLVVYEGIAAQNRSVLKRWDALQHFLDESLVDVQITPPPEHVISPTAYQQAVQFYLQRFKM